MTLRHSDLPMKIIAAFCHASTYTRMADDERAMQAALDAGWLPPEVVAYRIREAEREALAKCADLHFPLPWNADTNRRIHGYRETWHPALPDPLKAPQAPAPTLAEARNALDVLRDHATERTDALKTLDRVLTQWGSGEGR